jgi:hypothetical protein
VTATQARRRRQNDTAQVTLQRTPCYGTCPVYTVTVDRRGRFTWRGSAFVPVLGEHHGTFAPARFRALAALIDDLGFFDWDDEYSCPITDVPSTILTVERADVVKMVRQSGTTDPEGVEDIATFVDGIVAGVLWAIEGRSAPEPGT